MLTNDRPHLMTADDMERFAWIVTCSGFFIAVIFIVIFGGNAP